jgi:hypothetical protein
MPDRFEVVRAAPELRSWTSVIDLDRTPADLIAGESPANGWSP